MVCVSPLPRDARDRIHVQTAQRLDELQNDQAGECIRAGLLMQDLIGDGVAFLVADVQSEAEPGQFFLADLVDRQGRPAIPQVHRRRGGADDFGNSDSSAMTRKFVKGTSPPALETMTGEGALADEGGGAVICPW